MKVFLPTILLMMWGCSEKGRDSHQHHHRGKHRKHGHNMRELATMVFNNIGLQGLPPPEWWTVLASARKYASTHNLGWMSDGAGRTIIALEKMKSAKDYRNDFPLAFIDLMAAAFLVHSVAVAPQLTQDEREGLLRAAEEVLDHLKQFADERADGKKYKKVKDVCLDRRGQDASSSCNLETLEFMVAHFLATGMVRTGLLPGKAGKQLSRKRLAMFSQTPSNQGFGGLQPIGESFYRLYDSYQSAVRLLLTPPTGSWKEYIEKLTEVIHEEYSGASFS